MGEKINEWWVHILQAFGFAWIGIILSIGQHLKNKERWVWPVVIGRAICTGGVAMSSGAVLVWVPTLSMWGQIGVAAALASLGTAGLERLLTKLFQDKVIK